MAGQLLDGARVEVPGLLWPCKELSLPTLSMAHGLDLTECQRPQLSTDWQRQFSAIGCVTTERLPQQLRLPTGNRLPSFPAIRSSRQPCAEATLRNFPAPRSGVLTSTH